MNDDNFFPFEELLENTVLAFSRDRWVPNNSATKAHTPMSGVTPSGERTHCIPPSAVQPFRGFCMYVAPLCYLFLERGRGPVNLYFVFREMWARFWCKLNTVSALDGHLIYLCKMFEDLVQRYEPELFYHLLDLGIRPLSMAFPWMQHAFLGYFEVDQVLLLWDRILAWGDRGLLLLPVVAAAIFVFRSHSLMNTLSVQDVQVCGSLFKHSSNARQFSNFCSICIAYILGRVG